MHTMKNEKLKIDLENIHKWYTETFYNLETVFIFLISALKYRLWLFSDGNIYFVNSYGPNLQHDLELLYLNS